MESTGKESSLILPWQRKDKLDNLGHWLILLLLSGVFLIFFYTFSGSVEMYFELKQSPGGNFLVVCSKILLFINLGAIIWRLYLWKSYKPAKAVETGDFVSVSILVPAYNEEKSIYSTILSIIGSDYPKDKIQLTVIDDGSTDSTYNQILLAAEKCRESGVLPDIIRYKQNKGKRFALYQGFNRCRNEIIITIDSDSVILPDTLKNLVVPFQNDRNIGAVAGNVKVKNHHQGIIPRMLDVSFNYSFDFIRAGQSYIDAVLVTPGALSAYRAGLLHQVKDKWLNQHFLGVKVNIGEDRAMNNYIVSLGYRSVFQNSATVFTNVPVKYVNLCKMYLRWARSNIRESILMSSFVFKDFRKSNMAGLRTIYGLHLISLFVPVLLKVQIVLALLINPSVLLVQLLAGSLLVSAIPVMIYGLSYKSRNALWGFLYSVFFLFSLWWITPYALLTLKNNYWLTKK